MLVIFFLGGGDINFSGGGDVAICLLLFRSAELSDYFLGSGSVMEALLPEMALWEMHSGAKMVPFLLCF